MDGKPGAVGPRPDQPSLPVNSPANTPLDCLSGNGRVPVLPQQKGNFKPCHNLVYFDVGLLLWDCSFSQLEIDL